MKSITVEQFSQNPTAALAAVEAGETYRVIGHGREIARIVPSFTAPLLAEPKRAGGSRLAELPRRELQSAASIDELLSDGRDR